MAMPPPRAPTHFNIERRLNFLSADFSLDNSNYFPPKFLQPKIGNDFAYMTLGISSNVGNYQ
jgi:hypothetical protein